MRINIGDKLLRPGDSSPWFEVTNVHILKTAEWLEVTQTCATTSDGPIHSVFVAPYTVLVGMGWRIRKG